MAGHLRIGPVQPRIEAVGLEHRRLQVVGHHDLRHTAEECEHPDMRFNPVLEALGWHGLGIGVVGGPHCRDEQLHGPGFPGRGIDHVDHVAREVDEDLLAADMCLPHRRPDPPLPGLVMLAKPSVAKTKGMDCAILFPQQGARDSRAPQFSIHQGPVGHRTLPVRHRRRCREQQQLEVVVGQCGGKRPGQTNLPRPPKIRPDSSLPKPKRGGNRPLAKPLRILQP